MKIKAVIFDLDGVLIDATEWHYEALNRALKLFGFEITREMHVGGYNGLPTKKKLERLSEEKGFPLVLTEHVNKVKQNYTKDEIWNRCKPSFDKQMMLSQLKEKGYKLVVCSNSIHESIEMMLKKADVLHYFDFFIGNDEGIAPKPAPDIYIKALSMLNLQPSEAVIVEDAPHGVKAAQDSGANVCQVVGFHEVNYQRLADFINNLEGQEVC